MDILFHLPHEEESCSHQRGETTDYASSQSQRSVDKLFHRLLFRSGQVVESALGQGGTRDQHYSTVRMDGKRESILLAEVLGKVMVFCGNEGQVWGPRWPRFCGCSRRQSGMQAVGMAVVALRPRISQNYGETGTINQVEHHFLTMIPEMTMGTGTVL